MIRWFGATHALATLPGGVDQASVRRLTITSLSLWPAVEKTPTNITGIHPLVGLQHIRIYPAHLALPPGYTESGWPGYEKLPQIFPFSSDNGAKWRRPPR